MLNEFYEQEFKPLLPLNEEIETYTGMTFILVDVLQVKK
jgi:hypothetical protein